MGRSSTPLKLSSSAPAKRSASTTSTTSTTSATSTTSTSTGSATSTLEEQQEQEKQQQQASHPNSRPKRRATNAHIYRYLQYGDPGRLQNRDLKRALEASLEEFPDCAEDFASDSSSDHSNEPGASLGSVGSKSPARDSLKHHTTRGRSSRDRPNRSVDKRTGGGGGTGGDNNSAHECNCPRRQKNAASNSVARNPPNHNNNNNNHSNQHLPICPVHAQKRSKVHKRFKPVAKQNIYDEADFFHEGIMEFICYELIQFSKLAAGPAKDPPKSLVAPQEDD